MRSRYAAFAIGNAVWLLDSWHASTRPRTLELDDEVRWYRLDILARTEGGMLDSTGTVEFDAHFRSPAGAGTQHGHSQFVRESGRWFYVDEV